MGRGHTWRRLVGTVGVMWLAVVGFTGTSWADPPPDRASKSNASDSAAAHSKIHAGNDDAGAAPAPATSSQGEGGGGKTSCDPTHHSDTGHGANQSGAYDNTCEPEHEPGNGNDGSNAHGQPCAGCVGNADDKNPPGQAPDGSDHNRGYECDENQGVGKENPAHTGCAPVQPPQCVPSAANNFCGKPQCVPSAANNFCGNPPCVPSAANNFCGTPQPQTPAAQAAAVAAEVLGVSFTRPAAPAPAPAAVATLAFTGANLGRELAVATALLLVGTTLVLGARRRQEELIRIADRISI